MPKPAYLLRQAAAADIPALQQLWRASFAEDREGPFVEWYFRKRFQPQNCWLLTTQQGEVAAMCHAPLVTIQQREAGKISVPYIQGVATAEAHRGRGLCHRLLAAAEAELTGRGFPFCLLKPFNPAFYEPQGYRFCTYLRQYNIDLNQHFLERLPAYEPNFRLEFYLNPATGPAAGEVAAVYRQWCQQPGGPAAFGFRTAAEAALLLQDHGQDGGQLLLARAADGQPLAYALYTATANGLFVRELAFEQPQFAEKLLRALAADYREDTPAAVIITPDNAACAQPLPQNLAGWQVLPFAMLKPLTKPAPECYNMMRGAHFYEYF